MIKLADASTCTGCALCHDICTNRAIFMTVNEEGFKYPIIDNNRCVKCGKCQKKCPVINNSEFHQSRKAFYGRLDADIEFNSSGGLCKALSNVIMNGEGVLFGACLIHNEVKHIKVTNENECQLIFGSKYVQSNMEGIYEEITQELNNKKKVLFMGCPCQCDAVEMEFKSAKQYQNLYTCEILCHGVPSPGIFKDWISFLENKYRSKVKNYCFRSKKNGWSTPSIEIVFENRKRVIQSHNQSDYHKWFGRHLSLRESCFKCKYRNIERIADITMGDFWGFRDLGLIDDDIEKGTSVLMINTDKGDRLLKLAHYYNKMDLKEIKIEEAYINNLPSLNNFAIPREREKFFKIYRTKSINGIVKRYPAENRVISLLRRIKQIMITS